MKRLTKEDELEIRALLDNMGHNLHYDAIVFEDVVQSYQIIKKLLFEIYMLNVEKGGT